MLLVPPARRKRAELLLDLAGIDAVWGLGPTAEEIRKLDQERMLGDAIFAEETTSDDLVLARALLAERSPEDIAAALARLYRARLPSPEDLLDPGERSSRSREDRHAGKDNRTPRGDDREARPGPKKLRRDVMAEGSVWFRAAIGRKKNAEARWLLPMICRRGGVEKQDIGAIRVLDTTTEFEISARVADSFAAQIKRPDKEDNIRIELLGDAPAERPHVTKSWDGPSTSRRKPAAIHAGKIDRGKTGRARSTSENNTENLTAKVARHSTRREGLEKQTAYQARPDNDGRRHSAAAPQERAHVPERAARVQEEEKEEPAG